jgi:hypothetical protein
MGIPIPNSTPIIRAVLPKIQLSSEKTLSMNLLLLLLLLMAVMILNMMNSA